MFKRLSNLIYTHSPYCVFIKLNFTFYTLLSAAEWQMHFCHSNFPPFLFPATAYVPVLSFFRVIFRISYFDIKLLVLQLLLRRQLNSRSHLCPFAMGSTGYWFLLLLYDFNCNFDFSLFYCVELQARTCTDMYSKCMSECIRHVHMYIHTYVSSAQRSECNSNMSGNFIAFDFTL